MLSRFVTVLIVFSSVGAAFGQSCDPASAVCEAAGTAHCYYVEPGGLNSNNGSFCQPYKSFSPAISRARPGDFIYARAGSYNFDNASVGLQGTHLFISIQDVGGQYSVVNGTAGNPITVRNYPGEIPILNMNDARFNLNNQGHLAIVVREKSYWTISGFEVVNGSIEINAQPDGASGGGSLNHHIVIHNNNVHHLSVDGGSNPGLIRINRGDTGGPYEIQIVNNQLHDLFDVAQPGQWNNIGDREHFAALTMINCQSYYGYDCGGNGRIEIRGNTVYNVPQAFFFKNVGAGPVLATENLIHDADTLGFIITSNVTFTRNITYNVDEGFGPVGTVSGQDNVDFEADPRLLTISGQNLVVTYNTFVGLDLLFSVVSGTGHHVNNNIFAGMKARSAGADYDTLAYVKKSQLHPDPANPAQSILKNIVSNNNCFITPYNDFQMVQRHAAGNIEHYTKSQAQATFGFDPSSIVIIQSNPASIFVNSGAHDYHLTNPAQCPGMGFYSAAPTDTSPPAPPQLLQIN